MAREHLEDKVINEPSIENCPRVELPPLDYYEDNFNHNQGVSMTEQVQTPEPPKKKVTKLVTKPKVIVDELTLAVDKLIALKPEVDALALVKKDFEKSRIFLSGKADEQADAGESVVFTGTNGTVSYTAKKSETSFVEGGMEAIFNALGKEAFFKICNIPASKFEYIGAALLEQVVVKTQTGARVVSVHPNK